MKTIRSSVSRPQIVEMWGVGFVYWNSQWNYISTIDVTAILPSLNCDVYDFHGIHVLDTPRQKCVHTFGQQGFLMTKQHDVPEGTPRFISRQFEFQSCRSGRKKITRSSVTLRYVTDQALSILFFQSVSNIIACNVFGQLYSYRDAMCGILCTQRSFVAEYIAWPRLNRLHSTISPHCIT